MPKDELLDERDVLLAEIKATFAGVSRVGGISWSQADVLDDYGSEAEMAAALAQDTEPQWEDLIADPRWEPVGAAGFSFLDAIGFRYYLAPAMVRTVLEGIDEGIQFHLTLSPKSQDRSFVETSQGRTELTVPNNESSRAYRLEQWSALDEPQRRCVARFIQFMIRWSLRRKDKSEANDWQNALDGYWREYLA